MPTLLLPVFVFALALGTAIVFASSHWFMAWIGLEINTLAIIPLMLQKHHPRSVEATTKYFLVQSMAAATILFSSLSNAWMMGLWVIVTNYSTLAQTLTILALSMKIGLAPLHTWLPEVMQGINLPAGLILSTWQKLAPIVLMTQVPLEDSTILTILGLASVFIGGWGGLNQTQLRKLLAYSSISHMGWMMLVISFSPTLALMALTIYIFITSMAFLSFMCFCATNINKLSSTWAKNPLLATTLPIMFLSMASFPPLSGFMPKWMIMAQLTKQLLFIITVLACMASLLSSYFYLRVAYVITLTSVPNVLSNSTSWRSLKMRRTLMIALLTMMMIFLIPLAPGFLAIFSPN